MLRKINLGLKRFFDILISFACIIILFIIPVFEIVFIVIKLTSKGPAVFTQTRIGKDKKPFKMFLGGSFQAARSTNNPFKGVFDGAFWPDRSTKISIVNFLVE